MLLPFVHGKTNNMLGTDPSYMVQAGDPINGSGTTTGELLSFLLSAVFVPFVPWYPLGTQPLAEDPKLTKPAP